MANKVIITSTLKHYYDEDDPVDNYGVIPESDSYGVIPEPDKNKSISELTQRELNRMIRRVGSERELQQIIKELKRNAGEKDSYDNPLKVDTTTPINQLYHHGVLGMKWGVRRYQYKDGTRTPTGKKKQNKEYAKSDDHMNSRVSKSKATSGLSNEELRKVNERLQLESTYKNLTKNDMQNSQSWVNKALSSAGEQALTEFSKGLMLGSAKLLVKEFSPQFAETAFNIKEKKKD